MRIILSGGTPDLIKIDKQPVLSVGAKVVR